MFTVPRSIRRRSDTQAARRSRSAGRSGLQRGLLACAVVLALGACDQQAVNPTIEAATKALQEGRIAEAHIAAKQMLADDPERASARLLLGQVLLSVGDPAGAEIEFRKALKAGLGPDQVRPHLLQAMLDAGRAKALIEEFAAVEPEDPAAWLGLKAQLAEAHARTGDRGGAERIVQAMAQRNPNAVEVKLVRGRLLAAAGEREQALALAKAATAQADQHAPAWKLLGDIQLYLAADPAAAAASYQRMLALAPEKLDSHVSLITARMFQQDDQAAAEALGVLAGVAPSHPQTLLFQAVLAQRRNEHRRAVDLSQQILKMLPNSAVALQVAGGSMIELGDTAQAEALLSRAVYVAPRSVGARLLLSKVYLRQGRAGRAMETLRPLLLRSTQDAEVLLLAAESRLQEGQLAEAEQLFAAARKARPSDQRAALALARVRLDKGDSAGAIEELRRLAESGQDGQAELALFSAHLRQGDTARAIAVAEAHAKKQPKSALPHLLMARAYRQADKPAQVRASLERALELEPNFFPALSMLAMVDLSDRKADVALKRLQAAAERQPSDERLWAALAGLMASMPEQRGEVTAVLQKAVAAAPQSASIRGLLVNHQLQSRDRQGALVTAQAAVAALPQSAEAQLSLGKALMAAGNHLQAQKAFADASALQPDSVRILVHMADAAAMAGNTPAALSTLRRALEVDPASPLVSAGLMALARRSGAQAPALAMVQDIKRKRPDDAGPYLLEGDLLMMQRQTDAAIQAYRRGLDKRNASALAVRLHAQLLQNKRSPEARQFAADWQQRAPSDAVFQSHLADVALHAGDAAAAEALYRKAVALDARYPPATNGLAWTLVKNRRPDALEMARRAVALAPDRPEPLDTLAMAHAQAGEVDVAIARWRELLARWPEADFAQLHLATAMVDAKRHQDEARRLLDALVAGDHPEKLKAAARAQLGRLGA